MRLKTFILSYISILAIIFLFLTLASTVMTSSQIRVLRQGASREFQTIAASIARDIATLERQDLADAQLSAAVSAIAASHSSYYALHNIELALVDTRQVAATHADTTASPTIFFRNDEMGHFVTIIGMLSPPYEYYRMDFQMDIGEEMTQLSRNRFLMLAVAIAFSIVAAFVLHVVLRNIFRPLIRIDKTAKKIAAGRYDERAEVIGKGEPARAIASFNQMADKLEQRVRSLLKTVALRQDFIDKFTSVIKPPISSISENVARLQDSTLSESEAIASLSFLSTDTSYIESIINSLEKLSALTDYEPQVAKINLHTFFEEIKRSMQSTMQSNDISFSCDTDIDYLYAQEDLIKLLILCLCKNSMTALGQIDSEHKILQIEAGKKGENLAISVTDNGIGIPPGSLSKVTQPFYRVDEHLGSVGNSPGLGLTFCKQIAEAHKAKLRIQSNVGKGTKVTVVFGETAEEASNEE